MVITFWVMFSVSVLSYLLACGLVARYAFGNMYLWFFINLLVTPLIGALVLILWGTHHQVRMNATLLQAMAYEEDDFDEAEEMLKQGMEKKEKMSVH